MIRLYTEPYEGHTDKGEDISREFKALLEPLITRCTDEGISLRDLEYLLTAELGYMISVAILGRNICLKKSAPVGK